MVAYLAAGPRQIVHAQNPTVGFTRTVFTVAENQGPAVITVGVSATPAAGENIVVTYLTISGTATEGTGGDYISQSGTLTFTSTTQNTQSFSVVINNDNIVNEPDETVNLVLQLQTSQTAILGVSVATLIITDNDQATNTPQPTAATGTPIFVDLAEPNNTFEEAFQIQPDAAATCRLTLWPPGDLDYYSSVSYTHLTLPTSDLV